MCFLNKKKTATKVSSRIKHFLRCDLRAQPCQLILLCGSRTWKKQNCTFLNTKDQQKQACSTPPAGMDGLPTSQQQRPTGAKSSTSFYAVGGKEYHARNAPSSVDRHGRIALLLVCDCRGFIGQNKTPPITQDVFSETMTHHRKRFLRSDDSQRELQLLRTRYSPIGGTTGDWYHDATLMCHTYILHMYIYIWLTPEIYVWGLLRSRVTSPLASPELYVREN